MENEPETLKPQTSNHNVRVTSSILAIINELDALRGTRDDAWQIPREEGELLHHIALVEQRDGLLRLRLR